MLYDVPEEVQQLRGEQKAIINQAELHAAPLVVATLPESLRGREVIWFVDNTSAETSLVKSGSPTETMCSLALVASAALAGIGARTWFEHVPSPDNPADVLSRDGLADPEVARKVAAGEWRMRTPREPPWERGLDYKFWWQREADR